MRNKLIELLDKGFTNIEMDNELGVSLSKIKFKYLIKSYIINSIKYKL